MTARPFRPGEWEEWQRYNWPPFDYAWDKKEIDRKLGRGK